MKDESSESFCDGQKNSCQATDIDNAKLKAIFKGIYSTLLRYSCYSEEEFDRMFDPYKNYENKKINDEDFFRILVNVVFYSGFRASTVEKHLEAIHAHFDDYKRVSQFSAVQIESVKNDENMIQNHKKIDACITNARMIARIVDEFGSVENYIHSFSPEQCDECLLELKADLERCFKYIGKITSYHVMTDIGLNVLKPDRVIQRIFKRLGFLNNETDYIGAVITGRAFSNALSVPIRYIDAIFVTYGQLGIPGYKCICSEKNPMCEICGARKYCYYPNRNTKYALLNIS
jgi:DNA-3-methyladenine glycosylase I